MEATPDSMVCASMSLYFQTIETLGFVCCTQFLFSSNSESPESHFKSDFVLNDGAVRLYHCMFPHDRFTLPEPLQLHITPQKPSFHPATWGSSGFSVPCTWCHDVFRLYSYPVFFAIPSGLSVRLTSANHPTATRADHRVSWLLGGDFVLPGAIRRSSMCVGGFRYGSPAASPGNPISSAL